MKTIRCLGTLFEVIVLVVGLFATPLVVQAAPKFFSEALLAPMDIQTEVDMIISQDGAQTIYAPTDVGGEHHFAKLSTELNMQYAKWQKAQDINGYAEKDVQNDKKIEVRFTMAGEAGADAITVIIDSMGGEVTARYDRWLVAWVPISELGNLSERPDVYFIQSPIRLISPFEPTPAELTQQAGGCQTEGVSESGVDLWHANGWTGQGVKIAIFDNFNRYRELQEELYELPENIEFVSPCELQPEDAMAEYGHGVGAAEIIHDMAPDAQLAFVEPDNYSEWNSCLKTLVAREYDVISIAVGAFFGETPGDGTVDPEAPWVEGFQEAYEHDVIIAFSAGNDNLSHWSGEYADSGADGWHSFHPNLIPTFETYESAFINRLGERTIQMSDPLGSGSWTKTDFTWVSPSNPIWLDYYLRWNDWNETRNGNNSRIDYDLYLMKWDPLAYKWVYASRVWKDNQWWNPYSTELQALKPKVPPVEHMKYWLTQPGEYGIAIRRHSGSGIQVLDLHNYQGPALEVNVRERSLWDGAALPYVLGVGAFDLDWRAVAPYSGWGPIMGQGGTLAPPNYQQPFISGYSPVTVCSGAKYGGTSAATPHVAGAAAIIKSAYPNYSAQQIRDHLQANAKDAGPMGYDNVYGYGRLYLGPPPPVRTVIDFEDLAASPHGTPATVLVKNQYADKGITFTNPVVALDYSDIPGFAHSGSNAIEECYAVEFCTTPIRMDFAVPQTRVKVWIGDSNGWVAGRTAVLRAFDSEGNEVDSETAEDIFGSQTVPIKWPLEVTSGTATIRRVEVQLYWLDGGVAETNGLAIDDVEFEGASASTVGVFRPSNGVIFLKNTNTSGIADIALNYGLGGDYPVVGDWDGDGDDTIGVYRGNTFFLRNSNTVGFANLSFVFGQRGDQPIAGDWDGNGTDTIGVYRPTTGQFLLRNSNSAGPVDKSFYLGNVGDVAIAGDWNGDNIDTTGVFRPSNGVIFLKNTNETGFAEIALNYGLPGDKPVVGDWDSNGTTTIGIYRGNRFYLRNSNTNGFADITLDLGIPGDMPIAGNWDGLP